ESPAQAISAHTATFLTLKSFLPGMKQRHQGDVVTVCSYAGRRPHSRFPSHTQSPRCEARRRWLVTDLERSYPSAAACLAEDLHALCVHLAYPLRLRKRLRSTNLLKRSLEEVKRRTKVIGRFPWRDELPELVLGCARPVHRQRWRARPH